MVKSRRNMAYPLFSRFLLLFFILSPLSFAFGEVELELDPASGSVEDTYTYTLVVRDRELLQEPELLPSDDFQAEFVGSSSNVQIVNGRTSVEVRYLFELKPKRAGTLRTPEVLIQTGGQSEKVAPLTVAVSRSRRAENPGGKPHDDPDLFLVRELSKKVVYEGEQLFSNLKLYSRKVLLKGSFQDLLYDGFWKEDFGEPTVRSAHHQGEPVNIHEVRHVLFPLQSDTINLPPAQLNLVVREKQRTPLPWSRFSMIDPDFFGMGRTTNITVTSKESRLVVKKLPEIPDSIKSTPLAYASPLVGKSTVSLGLNTDPINVGESKTLVITLESEANIRSLNELTLHLPSSIKAYHDAPEEVILDRSDAFALKKRFRVSLVPEEPGTWNLDGISFLVFEPELEKYEVVTTRPITLVVNGTPSRSNRSAEDENLPSESRDEHARSGKEQVLYRYQEEGWLEYLGRTISLSLGLFLFSVAILFVGSLIFFYWLWRSQSANSRARKHHVPILRSENAAQLREDFSRELSYLLSPNEEAIYRGYLLEQKLAEALANRRELQKELFSLFDRLQSVSFQPESKNGERASETMSSSSLSEYAGKARCLLSEVREALM